MAEVNHQLKLERASLRSPQRIDLIAKTKLGLCAPSYSQIVVLSDPFPAEPMPTLLAKTEKYLIDPSVTKLHAIR